MVLLKEEKPHLDFLERLRIERKPGKMKDG